MSATSEHQRQQIRRRIRWRRVLSLLFILVLIVLPPIVLVGGSFLNLWNAPYGDWFVDANGQPVAGACEAAELLRERNATRISLDEIDPLHYEYDARKIADRFLVGTFGNEVFPISVPMLAEIPQDSYSDYVWVYIASLPPDPASDTLLSEAVLREKAALILVNAYIRQRVEVIAVADAAPPETCRREFRAVLRTTVNFLRDRTILISYGTMWAIYLSILFVPMVIYGVFRTLKRRVR